MKFNALNRKVHYWVTAFIALPIVIVIASGLLLQVKKNWSWVQPAEQRGTGTVPALDLEQILAAVKTVPEVGVDGWEDVNRFDVRPSKGMVKARLENGWEVQVDLGTGKVLQTDYRRTDLIESLHDGSFFGGWPSKLVLFLLADVALLLMWLSGLWMFIHPLLRQRRRRHSHPRP